MSEVQMTHDEIQAIVGDIRLTPDSSIRKLLAAVALSYLKDYLFGGRTYKYTHAHRSAIRRERAAEDFIFVDRPTDDIDPLSFRSICRVLNVRPEDARAAIRRHKSAGINMLLTQLKSVSRLADDNSANISTRGGAS